MARAGSARARWRGLTEMADDDGGSSEEIRQLRGVLAKADREARRCEVRPGLGVMWGYSGVWWRRGAGIGCSSMVGLRPWDGVLVWCCAGGSSAWMEPHIVEEEVLLRGF